MFPVPGIEAVKLRNVLVRGAVGDFQIYCGGAETRSFSSWGTWLGVIGGVPFGRGKEDWSSEACNGRNFKN